MEGVPADQLARFRSARPGVRIWITACTMALGAAVCLNVAATPVVFAPWGFSKESLWHATGDPGDCLAAGGSNGKTVVDTPGDPIGWWPLWSLAPCYAGNRAGPKVALTGDSITYLELGDGDIANYMGPAYSYEVTGLPGYRFSQVLPALRAQLSNPKGSPQDVIINLGTNDVLFRNPDWEPAFQSAMATAGNRCTLLVTVSLSADRPDAQSSSQSQLASQINAAERAWAHSHPNVHIIPWAELLIQDNYSLLGPDGIHPSLAGEQMLASMEAQQLKADCPT